MPQTSRFTRGQGFFGKLLAGVLRIGTGTAYAEYQNASVAISSANILAMNGAPVTILAAPGSGKAILVDSITFKMVATSTQYASGGAVSFVYHGGNVNVASSTIPAATINATAGTTYTLLGPAIVASGAVLPANTGVDITNATGAFTTGTGTAVAYIEYHVVTLP